MKFSPKLLVSLSLVCIILALGGVWGYSLIETTKKTSPIVATSVSTNSSITVPPISTPSTNTTSQSISSSASLAITTPTPTPTISPYSKIGVSKHSNSSDCWIIINDQVLDVTDYLPGHPGGASAITPYCGKDATTAFRSIRKHNGFAQKLLSEFVISPLQ
jgi:Cytochrome b5-like Heme/Steroid binding domain